MAHEIYNNDVFFELQKDAKAWHGLGERRADITPEFLASSESKFARDIKQQNAYIKNDDGTLTLVEDVRVNRFVDTGEIVATVGSDTHAPAKGFMHLVDIARPLVEAQACEIATAGTLRGGRRGYISLRFLTESFEADIGAGDTVVSFLMLKEMLDGKGAASLNLCNTRVVCANTLAVAEREAEQFGRMRFNHTATYTQTMASFAENVNVAKKRFEMTVSQYQSLARKDINANDLQKFVTLCLDIPETTLKSENKALCKIIENFERSEVTSTDGTWYKAYNAAQEYLQWQQGSKNTPQARRTDNMLFGPAASANRAWLHNALLMSGVQA